MRSFYFAQEKSRRNLYEVTGDKVKIHVFLNTEEANKTMDALLSSKISKVIEEPQTISIIYNNDMRVIYDLKIFEYNNDLYTTGINKIKNQITKYYEQKELSKYKDKTVTVKRKNNLSTKLIATGLGVTMFLSGLTMKYAKSSSHIINNPLPAEPKIETTKTESEVIVPDNYPKITYDNSKNTIDIEATKNVSILDQDKILIKNKPTTNESNLTTYNLDYEFEDRTSSSKSATVYNYCGAEIDYYAKRWGLSEVLTLAQMSQESPNPNKEGIIHNPCQITTNFFIGETFKVPVYNENGFTGTYDEFTCTKESLNSKEGNIMAGLAYLRKCIDKCDSIITGTFMYNQGEYSLGLACEYYHVNYEDYKGDENSEKACALITNYFQNVYKSRGLSGAHGDPNYIKHVFSYLNTDERGSTTIEAYINSEKVSIAINNVLAYNNTQSR